MITIDVNSERSIFFPGGTQEVSTLNYKRRLVGAQRVQFSSGTDVIELPDDATGKIEFKRPGRYDVEPITGAASWTKFGGGSSTYYLFLFALISDDLDRLFGINVEAPFTVTTNPTNLINAVGSNLTAGSIVNFDTTGTLPAGLLADTDYFVLSSGLTADAFQVSLTLAGPVVDITSNGTGTQSFVVVSNDVASIELIADIYVIHSSGTVEIKTQTFTVTVENDVTRAGDVIPDTPAIVYDHDTFWREGSGPPSNSLGLDGDFYINTQFGGGYGDVYLRASGTYSIVLNIVGASAGFRYQITNTTSGNPGTGNFSFDNGTFGLAHNLLISKTDKTGVDISPFLALQGQSSSSVKSSVIVRKVGTAAYFSFLITGALTDNGAWVSFPVTPIQVSGSIGSGDPFEMMFSRMGDKGDPGPAGTTAGPQGVQGAQGFQGFQGGPGGDGLDGAQGAQGNQGAQGSATNAFLVGAAVLDFGSTAGGASSDLTIPVTGAVPGEPVALAVPPASTIANTVYTAWISSAGTATVRFTNNDSSAHDPAAGEFVVAVITGLELPNGFSLNFASGSSQYVTAPGSPLNLNANFTFECWIKPTSQAAKVIFGGGTDGTHYWAIILTSSPGGLCLQDQSAGTAVATFTPNPGIAITNSVWTHIALTRSGNNFQWYINGVASGSPTVNSNVQFDTSNTQAIANLLTLFYDGKIDEVRLWNVARTPTQINANKSLVLTGFESGLVRYFRFEENAGSTAIDTTGNSNGTLTNAPTYSSDVPFS